MLYYNINTGVRLSRNQLFRQGLLNPGIDLFALGIIELDIGHDIDTDLYVAVDTGVTVTGGKARINYTPLRKNFSDPAPEKSLKVILAAKIDAKRNTLLASGVEFTFAGATHKLQTSRESDLINWLGLMGKVQNLPDGTPVSVQTEADETLVINSEDVRTLLGTAINLRSEIMEASWPLKRSIKAALADDAAFDLYEAGIGSVWPSMLPIAI